LHRRIGATGLPRSHPCLAVSGGPRWSSVDTVPRFLEETGSSSRELRSPPECVLLSPARPAPGTFREVSSLFATSAPGVLYLTSIPSSSAFHPQGFAPSRWFAPPRTLRACFIPLPRPGFPLQGFPPPGQPRDLVGPPFPLAVGVDFLLVGDHQRQSSSRRPQGVSGPGSAASTGAFSPVVRPYPLLRLCSLGLCFEDLGGAMNATSAPSLHARCCVCPVH